MAGSVEQPDLTLDQVDAVRRRVLNVVGHELRTPVTALSGLAGQLADADLDDIRSRLAPAIERLAQRTEALLDELLLAAGITTVLPVEAPVPVPVTRTVEDVWAGLGDAARQASLEVRGPADLAATAGPEAVRRALEHLLRNAASYGSGVVEVGVARDGPEVICEIGNVAPSVKDDELELAFEPFYRGEHAVMKVAGLGLGLTVSRALARHAGGDLRLERRSPDRVVAVLSLPGT